MGDRGRIDRGRGGHQTQREGWTLETEGWVDIRVEGGVDMGTKG